MEQDLTLPVGDGYVNLRVGAILTRGESVLMVRSDSQDYYYSVGGRIRFGESAEQAVVREAEEETGVRLEVDRLGFVEETYYSCDLPGKQGKPVYEIGFYYYMKTPAAFEPVCHSVSQFGAEERLEWVPFDTDKLLYPAFFRTELKHPVPYVRHFFKDDREASRENAGADALGSPQSRENSVVI